LDALNRRIGAGVFADGAVYLGTTLYGGRVAFRPVICNWMTRESDIEALVATVRRLGAEQLAR